jgi:hypothetical protein
VTRCDATQALAVQHFRFSGVERYVDICTDKNNSHALRTLVTCALTLLLLLLLLLGAIGCIDAHAADARIPASQPARSYAVSREDALARGNADPESATLWTGSAVLAHDPDGACRSLGLKSFEGVEEPIRKYVVAHQQAEPDDFVNITDMGDGGIVRMTLRCNADWWDGDQATTRRDRQRAEVKGLGPHQKDGETFEYGTTFRTDPDFKGSERFCHVFQLKATDGDKGAPLVVLSLLEGTSSAAVRYYSGDGGFKVAREFAWKPGEWQTVRIRVKTTAKGDGELLASVNGDEFRGVENLPMFRPRSTDYRPKWGFYRGVTPGMHDDWVEHKNATARNLTAGDTSEK